MPEYFEGFIMVILDVENLCPGKHFEGIFREQCIEYRSKPVSTGTLSVYFRTFLQIETSDLSQSMMKCLTRP